MRTKLLNRLAKLDEELARHFESVGHKSEAWYNEPPRPGKWSACQIHKHLMLSEGLSAKYVAIKSQYPDKLEQAGFQEKINSEKLHLYMSDVTSVKAPENVVPDDAPGKLEKTVDVWMHQRQELGGLIQNLDESLLNTAIYKHPIVGRLSLEGMLDFFHWHLQRHEKQIKY